MIQSKAGVLIAQKAAREGREIPYRVVTEETGPSSGVLARLVSSDFDRAERGTLDTLCGYFGCTVGDILGYVPEGR